ncbi:aminotransferase class III-fold pyridoxal phosphate-dependent enzyme [Methylocella sp.]|uniref:aminotransferase class III-fold pyridoxal phosphate-dependent enzyme n=1 Tax=Methylocella sp. TaxID=1978226 RepID=UPI003783DAF4
MSGPPLIPPEADAAGPPGAEGRATGGPAAAPPPSPDFSGAHEAFAPEAGDQGGAPDLSAQALAARLPSVSFGDRAFLLSSRRAAFAFALDLVRRRQRTAGRAKRSRLLVCARAASPAAVPDGLDGDVEILRIDDPDAVEAQITPRVAGFLIAPLRAEEGLEAVSGDLLASLRQACDDYGLALVFDESFCGLGRSGMMWAYEWTGATPDILVCGEGLAGPHELATVIATQKFAQNAAAPAFEPTPEALACAHAKLDALLSPGFLEHVQNRSWRLEDQLALIARRRPDLFRGVRGLGLTQGLLCAGPARPLAERLLERGLATRSEGDVLGLIAPLRVEDDVIDAAAALIASAFPIGFDPWAA